MHFLLTKVGIFQNFHKDMCLDYFLFESGMPKRIFWGMLDVLRFKIVDFGHLTFTIRWNLDIGEISDTSVKYWEICNSEGTFIPEASAVYALRVGIEEILKFRAKMNEQMSVFFEDPLILILIAMTLVTLGPKNMDFSNFGLWTLKMVLNGAQVPP